MTSLRGGSTLSLLSAVQWLGSSSWLVIRKKVHLCLAPTQQYRINDLIECVGRTAEEKLGFGCLELLEMILRFSVAMFTNNSPRRFWK